MVLNLKSRDYVFKMSIFKKLYCTVQCALVNVYIHIKKLSLRACCTAAMVANRSITASILKLLGVSDRWICNIIRHSKHFSSIEAVREIPALPNFGVLHLYIHL